MKSAWSLEILRLVILIASTVLVGIVSQAWVLSLSVHFLLYIAWTFYQISAFERWIYRGAHKTDAPDSTGIWQNMVQHLYRSQKSHKARKKQLASMANYYHAVMRALPDATVVVNKNHEIEWANKAANTLLGIKPNKDVGQRLDNIFRSPDVEQLFDIKSEVHRVQIESPTSPEITLSIIVQEYDENSFLLIAHDVSHRIATQKLRKAFIANASHELRTPLTVISGYLEILYDDEDLPPALNKVIKNAYEQATRMDNILDNLLVLSKLEGKQYNKTSGDDVDVKQMLEQLVADFRVSYADTKHTFVVNAEPMLLRVIEGELYSICQNLVSNAVKYSPSESEIRICWGIDEAGFGCLSVIDEGEGIHQEHINRLTERFYRVNQADRQVSGTGLGLSIVKHILDNFDGYLEIQSTVGEGSTFKACFPHYRVIDPENAEI
jgi:two-component system phosphate regulon sensor histidine kinase PhoR